MDTLLWRRAGGETPFYELSFDNDPAARLQFDRKRSVFGSGYGLIGRAGAGSAAWTFRHTHILGLTHQRVHVSAEGAEGELGMFKVRAFGSGSLSLADGGRFHFQHPSLLSEDRIWKTEAGEELMRMNTEGSKGMSRRSALLVAPEVRRRPEFPLLATLGCYLYIMHKGQQAQASRDFGMKTAGWWYDVLT